MGEVVRRIMCKVGTYGLWSNYNLKGWKTNLPFETSPVYTLVRRMYIFRVTTSLSDTFSSRKPYIVV